MTKKDAVDSLTLIFFPPAELSTALWLVKYQKISYENILLAYNKSKSWLRPLQVCFQWQGIHCPYAVLEFSWQLHELMTLKFDIDIDIDIYI